MSRTGVYNNYARATRLIDSFFSPYFSPPSPSRSIHRSCRPNNPPPPVSICAFHTFVYRRCVRAYVWRWGGHDSVERNNTVERSATDSWKGRRRTIFFFSLRFSLFLSLSRACVLGLHDERCAAGGERDARGENFLLWTSSDASAPAS